MMPVFVAAEAQLNVEVKPPALSEAAGSLRSPAAILMMHRGLAPAR